MHSSETNILNKSVNPLRTPWFLHCDWPPKFHCDLGKFDESKDCIVDSKNKILFGVTVKNICRGLFLSNHPWLALVTCGYMSLLAPLRFPFDLSQGDSILLTLSSHSRSWTFWVLAMVLFVFAFPWCFYPLPWSSSMTVSCPCLKILFSPHAHHL